MKNKWRISISGGFIITLILFFNSCTSDKTEIEKNCVFPDTVSFSKNILPILTTNCSIIACHSGSTPTGNLNLEAALAYDQLTNPRKGYVDTSDPKTSILYSMLVSSSNPMPPTGKLDNCSIELIERWMAEGARND